MRNCWTVKATTNNQFHKNQDICPITFASEISLKGIRYWCKGSNSVKQSIFFSSQFGSNIKENTLLSYPSFRAEGTGK